MRRSTALSALARKVRRRERATAAPVAAPVAAIPPAAEQESVVQRRRIETARQERAELAAALVEERRLADALRVGRRRDADEMRRAEAAERAQERADQRAQRRLARYQAAQQAAIDQRDKAMQRECEAESRRGGFVRVRSVRARELAVAWGPAVDAALRAASTFTAPLPGEDGPRPAPELRAPLAFCDPLTDDPVRYTVVASEIVLSDDIDARALDIEALNRQLASAPAQGTRAASAHRRSKP